MPSSRRPRPGPVMRRIASLLRERYPAAGFTQASLGDVIGVSQSQMSRILLGERTVDVDQLQLLCNALGIDIGDLVKESESSS